MITMKRNKIIVLFHGKNLLIEWCFYLYLEIDRMKYNLENPLWETDSKKAKEGLKKELRQQLKNLGQAIKVVTCKENYIDEKKLMILKYYSGQSDIIKKVLGE